MRISKLLVPLLLLVLVAAACGPGAAPTSEPAEPTTAATEAAAEPTEAAEDPAEGGEEKVLRIGAGTDILGLDPALMRQVPDWPIATAVYSGLVKYEPGVTAEVQPDLATDWEVSEDGTEWTFNLRQGVQWHDGYGELTAQDVVWTYERIKDPELGSPYLGDLSLLETIEAVDDYTVKLTFSSPSAAFLSAVAAFRPGRIVNQQAFADFGEDYTANAVGSGPYMLESWTPGSEIVLIKNPEHWDADAYEIDRIVYKIIPEPSVRVLALQSGDIDLLFPDDPEGIAQLKSAEDITVIGEAGTNIVKVYLNTTLEPFDDIRVRRALNYAVDKEVVSLALEGIAEPALSEIPPFMAGYTDDVPQYSYDPEAARDLLQDAGYGDGFEFNVIVWDWGTYPRAAEALPDMLREVGIDVKLEILEGGLIRPRLSNGEYDGAMFGLGRVDPHQVLYRSHSANIETGQNASFYAEDGLDEVLVAQEKAMERSQRDQLLAEAQTMMREAAITIPLYVEKIHVAFGDHVTGVQPGSQNILPWSEIDIES